MCVCVCVCVGGGGVMVIGLLWDEISILGNAFADYP